MKNRPVELTQLQEKIVDLAMEIWGLNYPTPLTNFCKEQDIELSHITISLCKRIIKLLEERK